VTAPRRSYLVCATQRSGSSLLCEALRNTGLAGRPAEYLLDAEAGGWESGDWARARGVSSRAEFVRLVLRLGTTPNGVFGSKLLGDHRDEAVERLRPLAGAAAGGGTRTAHGVLSAAFPGLRYVRLTRRDRVRQAVSWLRAAQTGRWAAHVPADDDAAPRYDAAALDAIVRHIGAAERAWDDFFRDAGIEPHGVTYEGLVAAYGETALGVLDFLGVPYARPLAFGVRRLVRQADAESEAWARRYAAERAREGALDGSPPRSAPGGERLG
jgi:LPS sulfotransferase NodH